MSKYIIKNCPCFCEGHSMLDYYGECLSLTDDVQVCQDCTNCLMKQIVEKLREADNSCDGIDCTECSGFYMCHSKLANDVLKLLDIQEILDD